MLEFLTNNLGTVITLGILIVLVFFIFAFMIRNKKTGRSSCSGGCTNCPFSGKCSK